MCAQVEVKLGVKQLRALLGQIDCSRELLPNSGLLCGKDSLLIVTRSGDGKSSERARWGLVGGFLDREPSIPMITLKCEGLASTPFYGKLLKGKRALIPVTAFFEHQTQPGGKTRKFKVSQADGRPMMLAGVFDSHRSAGTTCAILTVGSDRPVSAISNRMPVIVARDEWNLWLDNSSEFPDIELDQIMQPMPDGSLKIEEVAEPEPSPQLSFAFT